MPYKSNRLIKKNIRSQYNAKPSELVALAEKPRQTRGSTVCLHLFENGGGSRGKGVGEGVMDGGSRRRGKR